MGDILGSGGFRLGRPMFYGAYVLVAFWEGLGEWGVNRSHGTDNAVYPAWLPCVQKNIGRVTMPQSIYMASLSHHIGSSGWLWWA